MTIEASVENKQWNDINITFTEFSCYVLNENNSYACSLPGRRKPSADPTVRNITDLTPGRAYILKFEQIEVLNADNPSEKLYTEPASMIVCTGNSNNLQRRNQGFFLCVLFQKHSLNWIIRGNLYEFK